MRVVYIMLMERLFQITCARPGFSAGGKFWLEAQDQPVANQYDDNDLDVAYYTQVKKC